jgi:hypothetical protein
VRQSWRDEFVDSTRSPMATNSGTPWYPHPRRSAGRRLSLGGSSELRLRSRRSDFRGARAAWHRSWHRQSAFPASFFGGLVGMARA